MCLLIEVGSYTNELRLGRPVEPLQGSRLRRDLTPPVSPVAIELVPLQGSALGDSPLLILHSILHHSLFITHYSLLTAHCLQ